MISFGPMVRVFVATQPIDFRKGVHGLIALVAEGLGGKPYSGDVCLPIEAIGSFEASGF
jgi:transposase